MQLPLWQPGLPEPHPAQALQPQELHSDVQDLLPRDLLSGHALRAHGRPLERCGAVHCRGRVRVLSSISGSINGFFPAFYNGSSSIVGLKSSGAALVLAETSFGGQTPTTILEPPALGTLDSLVVRNGIIYVSQSLSPARQSTLSASLTTTE